MRAGWRGCLGADHEEPHVLNRTLKMNLEGDGGFICSSCNIPEVLRYPKHL